MTSVKFRLVFTLPALAAQALCIRIAASLSHAHAVVQQPVIAVGGTKHEIVEAVVVFVFVNVMHTSTFR